jgi:hypothetical protein
VEPRGFGRRHCQANRTFDERRTRAACLLALSPKRDEVSSMRGKGTDLLQQTQHIGLAVLFNERSPTFR